MFFAWLLLALVVAGLLVEWRIRAHCTRHIADIFENVPPFNVVAGKLSSGSRSVETQTSDGVRLRGSLFLPERSAPLGLVIFFHEIRGNHAMAPRYCQALLSDGFAILGFDFRNEGGSDSSRKYEPIHWITEYEMTDVAGVFEFIESDPQLSTLPLLAFGVSRGGVAALLAGCRYPRIRAVIADSAFGTMPMALHFVDRFVRHVIPRWLYSALPDWHVRMSLRQGLELSEQRRGCRYAHLENEVAGLSDTPVLLISGGRDTYVTPEVARQLWQVVGPTAELWVVDGAKHNLARMVAPDEYDRRIVQHFRMALAPDLRPAGNASGITGGPQYSTENSGPATPSAASPLPQVSAQPDPQVTVPEVLVTA